MSNRIVPDLQRVDRGQFTVAFLSDDVRLVLDVRDQPNAGDLFDGHEYPGAGCDDVRLVNDADAEADAFIALNERYQDLCADAGIAWVNRGDEIDLCGFQS